VSATGEPPSGGVVALQFRCDGTLFGGTARGNDATDGGRLVTINPATGVFAFVGASSPTGGNSLGALAFSADCSSPVGAPIPTLSGWAMMGLAALLMGLGAATLRWCQQS